MSENARYNPLDSENLARSVATALLKQEPVLLSRAAEQIPGGAGIYAIYYCGDYPLYARLANTNRKEPCSAPLYIGKAETKGKRKGLQNKTGLKKQYELRKRLLEHVKSIEQTKESLNIMDFHCRFVVVEDIWIPLGETLLISEYRPIWNVTIDGFGNHAPGKGRRHGKRSNWDMLHPGRPWASDLPERPEGTDAIEKAALQLLEEKFPQ